MSIILGVTGSIAAYKSPDLVRRLKKEGFDIIPIVSNAALNFVTPLSLSIVSGTKAYTDKDNFEPGVPHLSLSKKTSIMIIAPASANTIAKLAHGICDSLLTETWLAFTGKKCIAPAMHTEMWENPITQGNIAKLKAFGVEIIGPEAGDLACGDEGTGRMSDPEIIVDKIKSMQFPKLNLEGKSILITSGGTKEPLDCVRVLTNLSTGNLGQALAKMAFLMGAKVTLISTMPVKNPGYKALSIVESVDELKQEIEKHLPENDSLYMAAAVSDYTTQKSESKLKRSETLTLNLVGTPDILKSLADKKENKTFIGFCLADENLEATALKKLADKKVDYIVANTSQTIGQKTRSLSIYGRNNTAHHLHEKSLDEIAYELLKLSES